MLSDGTIVPLSTFTQTSYQSRDLAPFTISPQIIGAGGTITITFGAADPVSICCSDALITGATLDGAPVTATSGSLGLYDYDVPVPDPDAGAIISVPTSGSHTATFEIDPAAATENITDEDYFNGNGNTDSGTLYAYAGPWITGVSDDGSYSSAQPFNIVGNSNTLSFIQQPSNTASDDTIKPPVTVAVQNSGVTDLTNTDSITLALSSGNGTLTGTLTEPAVAGVATFSNLSIDNGGTYTLTASDGSMTPVLSSAFDISAGKLVFTKPPADGSAGAALNPAVTVSLEDAGGNVATDDNSTVVTLDPVGVSGAGPITGNIATLTHGVATFPNLVLTTPGTYALQATDGGDAQATSGKFKVGGDHLTFTKQPANGDANVPLLFKVSLKDAKNNVVTDENSDAIQLTLQAIKSAGTANLTGTTTLAFVNGVATFTAAQGVAVTLAGTYSLIATEVDGAMVPIAATPAAPSKAFVLGGFHLDFKKKPTSADVAMPLLFSVAVEDAKGKVQTDVNSGGIMLTSAPGVVGTGSIGHLSTYTDSGFANGIDTFTAANAASFNLPGTFALTAAQVDAGGVAVDTTATAVTPVKILGLHIAIVNQPPASVPLFKGFAFKLQVEDPKGKLDANVSDIVSLASTVGVSVAPSADSIYATFVDGVCDVNNAYFNDGLGAAAVTFTAQFAPVGAGSYASDPEVAPATSRTVKVTGYHIAYLTQPANQSIDAAIPFKIAIEDVDGKVLDFAGYPVTVPPMQVLITSSPHQYVSRPDNGYPVLFANGIIDFPPNNADGSLDPNSVLGYVPGPVTVTVAAVDTLNVASGPIAYIEPATSRTFKIFPDKLVFQTQPTGIAVGFPVPAFNVAVETINGEVQTFDNSTVLEATYRPAAGGASVPFGTAMVVNGIAQFRLDAIPTAGRFVITVEDAKGLDVSAISDPFTMVTG